MQVHRALGTPVTQLCAAKHMHSHNMMSVHPPNVQMRSHNTMSMHPPNVHMHLHNMMSVHPPNVHMRVPGWPACASVPLEQTRTCTHTHTDTQTHTCTHARLRTRTCLVGGWTSGTQDQWTQKQPEWLATSPDEREELSQAFRMDAGNYDQKVSLYGHVCLCVCLCIYVFAVCLCVQGFECLPVCVRARAVLKQALCEWGADQRLVLDKAGVGAGHVR